MAPPSAPAARPTPGAASVGTGTRPRVMPARTAAGTGPGNKNVFNWLFLCNCAHKLI